MKRFIATAAAVLTQLILPPPAGADERARMVKIAEVGNRALSEISGMVASRVHEGAFWVHNDSGNEARLFAIDLQGRTVAPEGWVSPTGRGEGEPPEEFPGIELWSASNVDWEDIAAGEGLLFIADVGNNGNSRRNLGIYVLEEPDPHVVRAAPPLSFIPVFYPEQRSFPARRWHYDCEAVFYHGGKLYFLTKHRRPGEVMGFEPGTVLYRLDSRRTDRPNPLVRVGSHDQVTLATAADLSPSGDRLAVLTYRDLWIFQRPGTGDDWLSGSSRRLSLDRRIARQNEAITWLDGQTLLMANEEGDLVRIELEPRRATVHR